MNNGLQGELNRDVVVDVAVYLNHDSEKGSVTMDVRARQLLPIRTMRTTLDLRHFSDPPSKTISIDSNKTQELSHCQRNPPRLLSPDLLAATQVFHSPSPGPPSALPAQLELSAGDEAPTAKSVALRPTKPLPSSTE